MGKLKTFTRRTLLVGTAAIAGGVILGYWRYKTPYGNPLLDDLKDGESALTPYVRLDADGITIITPRAEMGQGVHTTLAAMVAEELDVSLDAVKVEHGPASKAYYNSALLEEMAGYPSTDNSDSANRMRHLTTIPAKFLGMQVTGGSTSTPDGYVKMRMAGAAARDILLSAAAARLSVSKDMLTTDNGAVVTPNGEHIAYTELAAAAADFEPADDLELKAPSEWKLLGRSLPRVDMLGKVTGTAEYSIDINLPDMLFATVKMNPHLGSGMKSFDASAAEKMPGVRKIIPLNNGVAVIATNTWYAFKAADAIEFDWQDATYSATTDDHFSLVIDAFSDEADSQMRNDGDVAAAFIEADTVSGEYRVPYLAHATMEPMNAVALFKDDRLDVWAGNQNPTQATKEGEDITGLDGDNIHIHTTMMGGGFGRRNEMDFIRHAISVAHAMPGIPVKTSWSREEDMSHDSYRPLAVARFKGVVSNDRISALQLDLASPSVMDSTMERIGMSAPGPDAAIVQAAWDQPYKIRNYQVNGYRASPVLPLSFWRSVGASQNGFFHECVLDELAATANIDPLKMRLLMMNDHTSRKVLEAVAEMSNWDSDLPEGHARGVAFVLSFGVPTAEVIEVAATENGIKIINAYAAVDVGTALDPRNIEAQVQSGINFGLAAAISGEITVADGVVEQTNFHNYDSIRMNQAPNIEVKILENGPHIRGIGEPGTPPAAPALANAIFAATGQRIRELPLKKQINFV